MKLNLKLSLLMILLIAVPGVHAYAQSFKSPFLALAGSWRGSGKITPPGGQPERVRCRVSYRVFSSGNKAKQRIRCAGPGYRITATSNLRYTPGNRKIRGTWSVRYGDRGKRQKSTGGAVRGDYINNTISISLINPKQTGNMSVRLQGKRRQILIINHIAKLDLRR